MPGILGTRRGLRPLCPSLNRFSLSRLGSCQHSTMCSLCLGLRRQQSITGEVSLEATLPLPVLFLSWYLHCSFPVFGLPLQGCLGGTFIGPLWPPTLKWLNPPPLALSHLPPHIACPHMVTLYLLMLEPLVPAPVQRGFPVVSV